MKRGFPLFKWAFFSVLVIIVGVVVTVAVLAGMRKRAPNQYEVVYHEAYEGT